MTIPLECIGYTWELAAGALVIAWAISTWREVRGGRNDDD